MVCKFKFVCYGHNKRKMKDPGSRLPRSKYWPWEPTPRIKIFSLGAGSQVQNLDPGSRLPGSKSLLWEPAPKFQIFTLGAGSQVQNLDPGSRLPETWESNVYTCNLQVRKILGNVNLDSSFCQWLSMILLENIPETFAERSDLPVKISTCYSNKFLASQVPALFSHQFFFIVSCPSLESID